MSLYESLDVEVFCNDVALSNEWLTLSEDEIKRIVQDILIRGAIRIAGYAKASAPVKTGRLRDSIQAQPTSIGASIIATVPYAAVVDQGYVTASGTFVAANPFFTNAVAQVMPDIEREIDEEINAYLRLQKP